MFITNEWYWWWKSEDRLQICTKIYSVYIWNFHYSHTGALLKVNDWEFYTVRPTLGHFPVNAKILWFYYKKKRKILTLVTLNKLRMLKYESFSKDTDLLWTEYTEP
jgi:hypothetical protein